MGYPSQVTFAGRSSTPQSVIGQAYRHWWLGELPEAEAACRQVLQEDPQHPSALHLLGVILHRFDRPELAMLLIRQAIGLQPDVAEFHNSLGAVLLEQGSIEQSISCFRQALEIQEMPNVRSNLLLALQSLPDADSETLFKEAIVWGRLHGNRYGTFSAHTNRPDAKRRLRVGYVSADLQHHPVAYFLAPVLANHDPIQIETYCYSNHYRVDDLTERLQASSDHWRLIAGLSDHEAAELIREDSIDILVDLSGHTSGNRLGMFSRRPAPVQATWIGYSATTGSPAFDYIIADSFVCPAGADSLYVEKVIRLPNAYLCYEPQTALPAGDLPALSAGHVTFGCFNKLAKISPEVISLWSEILRAVPQSRICLKAGGFQQASLQQHYTAMFAKNGIVAERITFLGQLPYAKYLEAYREIDIALDPFPYNGCTNTVEALWMGVPVVTLAGDRFISRVGLSLLSTTGLGNLVADSRRSYLNQAIALASSPQKLADLRGKLREQVRQSALCDGPRFASNLDHAYRNIWRDWCRTQTRD